ncbi:esterase E4-like [Anticarsia gemmatalis]|uniref:esterase E4-like n=1 Tax=Anticarsia gemmatalis TaxID=129554 RepID=UPI003F774330
MLAAALVCAALACLCATHASGQHEEEACYVHSEIGSFRGSWMTSRRGRLFQAYRGIRYALPPTDELRFKPPVGIWNYRDEVNATRDGPACPQPGGRFPVHEDCLRLNVYTPDIGKRLPVVVFVHPGGFYSQSGRSEAAGPHHLLDHDLVLVTINYRLATLGFLSTGDEHAPGNNGFKDQVAALQWVQRNIAAFGGDPHLVTLAGYSAGAFSVMLHTVSPMSKGLFHRAIANSGSAISQIPVQSHQRHLAVRQAQLLNCPTDTSKAIVDCLRTKSAEEIGNSLSGMFEFGYDPVLLWMPVVEEDFGQERFLVRHPVESFCNGDLTEVPFIVSQTTDEFYWKAFKVLKNATLFEAMCNSWCDVAPSAFILPRAPHSHAHTHAAERLRHAYLPGGRFDNDAATADGLGKLYADAIIGFGVHRLANLMVRHSRQPVYYYEFAYIGNNSYYYDPVTKKPPGAAHHDDLIYLFNISRFEDIPPGDTLDSDMVDKMTAIWYNFMRYGDPNAPIAHPGMRYVYWPPMSAARRLYLHVAREAQAQSVPLCDTEVRRDLLEDRMHVWEELYPLDYDTCQLLHA